MPWPLSQDYNEAVQNADQCFSDPDLKQSEAVTNALGLPLPCSGNFADVYAMVSGQKKWAVKCFTRQIPGLAERYAEISKYLPQVQLPFMVDFQFLEQGIRVRGPWYPILKMQWVEGFTLNSFVRDNLDKPQTLQTLCQLWQKLATRLREANLAHCDLQHGNVLLVPGKVNALSLKLVDYDGMCVPALEMLKSIELGHPSYQHPQRLREGTYGLHIDRFPHLVIYTAMRCLAVGGKALWEKFDNGDNLLFSQKDFEAPRQSPVFQEVMKLNDPEVRKLVVALANAAQKPIDQVPLIDDLVTLPKPKPVAAAVAPAPVAPTPAQPQKAPAASPFAAATSNQRRGTRYQAPRNRGMGVAVVVGAVFGFLALVGVGAVLLMSSGKQQPTESQVVQEVPRSERSPTKPPSPSRPSAKERPVSVREPKLEPKIDPKTDPTVEPKPEPKPDLKPEPKVDPKPDPEPKDKRTPVPDGVAQEKAEALVKDLFKDEFAKKTSAEKLALSTKLLEQAGEAKDDATQFVLFREARDLAAQAGNAELALTVVDQIAKQYVVDGPAMKVAALEIAAPASTTAASSKALADAALALLDEVLVVDAFEAAGRLVKVAMSAARNAKSVALSATIQARSNDVELIKKENEKAKTALATLEENPKDAAASLTAGRYLCLFKGDWDKGLTLLAGGSDGKLKKLAERDVARPESAADQVALGDEWWDLAEKEKDRVKRNLQARAGHWYGEAAPELTGATKTRVETRLSQVKDASNKLALRSADIPFEFKTQKAISASARYAQALRAAKDTLVSDLKGARKAGADDTNLIAAAVSAITPAIPGDRVSHDSHYYRLFTEPTPWHVAKRRCEMMGGHLAWVMNEQEDVFLSRLSGTNQTWLGASDERKEGDWKWINGKSLTYTHWGQGQPDNHDGIEHHLVYSPVLFGVGDRRAWWNDVAGGQRLAFLCQWDTIGIVPTLDLRWAFRSKDADKAKRAYLGSVRAARRQLVTELGEALKEAKQPEETQYIRDAIALVYRPTPKDRIAFGKRYYKLFHEEVTWHVAKATCEAMGGRLACVPDGSTNAFLHGIARGEEPWFGATDEEKKGDWVWVNGEPMTYSNWHPGEPNNKDGGEHHLVLVSGSGKWADNSTGSRRKFICEWDE